MKKTLFKDNSLEVYMENKNTLGYIYKGKLKRKNAYLKGNLHNILLDVVSRPNIAYECKVVKNLNYLYQGCGRLREITPIWDTSLVTATCIL